MVRGSRLRALDVADGVDPGRASRSLTVNLVTLQKSTVGVDVVDEAVKLSEVGSLRLRHCNVPAWSNGSYERLGAELGDLMLSVLVTGFSAAVALGRRSCRD